MTRGGRVALREPDTGEVIVHAEGDFGPGYSTLCGRAVDGDEFSAEPAKARPGARISCLACWRVWGLARKFRSSDFSRLAKAR